MLTDHEATVLEIMSRGEDMMAIGTAEPVMAGLVLKGYVRPLPSSPWHRATPAGLAALKAHDEPKPTVVMIEGECEDACGLPAVGNFKVPVVKPGAEHEDLTRWVAPIDLPFGRGA